MRLVLCISLLLSGCIGITNIAGVYKNVSEPGINHYVHLKPDGLFEHIYESGTIKLVNTGKWKYLPKRNQISIDNWIDYGRYKGGQCDKGCFASFVIKEDEIILSKDLPERNFKKTN